MKTAYILLSILALSSAAQARGHYEDTDCDAKNDMGSFHLYIDDTYQPAEKSRLSLLDPSGKAVFVAQNDYDRQDQFVILGQKTNIKTSESRDDRYTYTTEIYTEKGEIRSISPEASKGLGLKMGDVLNLSCKHETIQR